ncbi:glycosyltransferase [Vibrio sp. DNB22_19_1]
MKKTIISIMPHLRGGGVEKVVSLLSQGLSQFSDCDVHIITIKPFDELIPLPEEVTVHRLDTDLRNFLNVKISNKSKAKIIYKYITDNITSSEPDLILCHQETVSKIMVHCKYKNMYHVIHSNLSNDRLGHSKGITRQLRKRKLQKLYQNIPVICVSKGVEEDLKTTFKLKKTRVIYNAIQPEKIKTLASENIKLPQKPYFIHVGNFTRAKRQDRLVRAYLESGIEDVDLVLLGEHTDITNEVKRILSDYENHADRVHMPGFKSNPYPWIAASRGFILSSDYEGLPTVLLESIALGIPTISTNCKSGPSEIFGENNKHCLCELNVDNLKDKIIEAYTHPQKFIIPLRTEFSLESMCRTYYKLIKA